MPPWRLSRPQISKISPTSPISVLKSKNLCLPLNCYYSFLRMCHPCVSVCHPLKRCKPFVHRGSVSLSPFNSKNPVYITGA